MKKFSDKRQRDEAIYNVLRNDFLLDHPVCQASIAPICTYSATQIHHKCGRGSNLTNVDTFLAVCHQCHQWIENNPKMAKELGFSESRLAKIININVINKKVRPF